MKVVDPQDPRFFQMDIPGVSPKRGGNPKMDGWFIMENPLFLKWDDLGGKTTFLETPISLGVKHVKPDTRTKNLTAFMNWKGLKILCTSHTTWIIDDSWRVFRVRHTPK